MNYAPEEDDVRPTDFVPAVPETGGWMNLYATGGGYPTIPHIQPPGTWAEGFEMKSMKRQAIVSGFPNFGVSVGHHWLG